MFGLLSKILLSLAGIDFGSQTIKAVTISGRPGKVHLGLGCRGPHAQGQLWPIINCGTLNSRSSPLKLAQAARKGLPACVPRP